VHVGRDTEALAGLGGPAVRVLPGVAEPEDQGPQVVGLELPEDVAGAQAAADPEDHGLRQRPAFPGDDDQVEALLAGLAAAVVAAGDAEDAALQRLAGALPS
jgi:hypothetical protein